MQPASRVSLPRNFIRPWHAVTRSSPAYMSWRTVKRPVTFDVFQNAIEIEDELPVFWCGAARPRPETR